MQVGERKPFGSDVCARQPSAARILLKADTSEAGESWNDRQIAQAPETSAITGGRIRRQLVEEGLDSVLTRKHSPNSARRRIFDGAAGEHARAPSTIVHHCTLVECPGSRGRPRARRQGDPQERGLALPPGLGVYMTFAASPARSGRGLQQNVMGALAPCRPGGVSPPISRRFDSQRNAVQLRHVDIAARLDERRTDGELTF
jgi:hypothetical protein